jgi:GT2 family glycosyltransferase
VLPPRLLVVIPTLGKRTDYFAHALESCRELGQHIPLRVCVVAPSDAVEARIQANNSGATVIDDPGTGMADAVNAALSTITTEEFYVWLGDDDALVAEGVVALVGVLDLDLSCVVAFGGCNYVDNQGRSIMTTRASRFVRFLLPWGPNFIPHPGTVIRVSALREVGGFTPGLSYALDLDVFLRLRRLGTLRPVPVIASRFRWHHESLTVASRGRSGVEALRVKTSHLPKWLRPLSGLWNWPILWLSFLAARVVSAKAIRLAAREKQA